MEILSRKEHRARRARRCDTCHGEIVPGESYVHSVFVDSGRVYDYNQHIHCEALCERYCMAMGVNEYDDEDVEWWAQDEVCTECDKRDDACEHTALTCPLALEALLPPAILTHEDVRRHIDVKEVDV